MAHLLQARQGRYQLESICRGELHLISAVETRWRDLRLRADSCTKNYSGSEISKSLIQRFALNHISKQLGGNVLLEPAASMFLMLILVMIVSHFSQSHNELIDYSNFLGSHLSREVNFLRKSTPGSLLSREVNFPGKSTFPGSQLSQEVNFFQEINFPGNSSFPREVNFSWE